MQKNSWLFSPANTLEDLAALTDELQVSANTHQQLVVGCFVKQQGFYRRRKVLLKASELKKLNLICLENCSTKLLHVRF